jgi:hypothetical protein
MTKCAKCIQYYLEQKRRFELIKDLKAKSEGLSHAILKTQACDLIRVLGGSDRDVYVEPEVLVEGIGKVDVVGKIDETTIAIECGNTTFKKIVDLKKRFDVVLHIPYRYTPSFVKIDVEEIEHQLITTQLTKRLKKKLKTTDWKIVRNKVYCLEEGECSLPSGRGGYPHEAMKIAGIPVEE